MNVVFLIVFLLSIISIIFISPDLALASMISGGEKALTLSFKLIVIYAVWLGIFEIMERSNLSRYFAKILKPINRVIFGKLPEKAEELISLNMSANFLGMSGATTPLGIKAIGELEKHPFTDYAIAMFFVINATSIQLIPSSVISLRASLGSVSPSDIILPTLLATTISCILGIILVKIFVKKPKLLIKKV